MADPYATTDELADFWRPLTPAEVSKATLLLRHAALEIDTRCPPADPPTDLAARNVVSLRMVKRAMMPSAAEAPVTNVSMAAGPFNTSQTFANPMGDLYLTKADLRLLGCGKQTAFTVSMWPDEDEEVPPWSYLLSEP